MQVQPSEPLETGIMKNKIESMKHDQLDQLHLEDEMDASTKVSSTEVIQEIKEVKPMKEIIQPISHKDIAL